MKDNLTKSAFQDVQDKIDAVAMQLAGNFNKQYADMMTDTESPPPFHFDYGRMEDRKLTIKHGWRHHRDQDDKIMPQRTCVNCALFQHKDSRYSVWRPSGAYQYMLVDDPGCVPSLRSLTKAIEDRLQDRG